MDISELIIIIMEMMDKILLLSTCIGLLYSISRVVSVSICMLEHITTGQLCAQNGPLVYTVTYTYENTNYVNR